MNGRLTALITGPSLDESRNVSGISSVVRHIMTVNATEVEFVHLRVGMEQTWSGARGQLRSILLVAKGVWGVLTRHFDVLHSNMSLNTKSIVRESMLIVAARARGKPVVLHLHGGKYGHDIPGYAIEGLVNLTFRLANSIVTLSQLERERMIARYPADREKFRVIYNGASASPVRLPRARAPELRVGYIGRFAEEKGIQVMTDAISLLAEELPIKFAFYGDGPLRKQLEDAAAKDPRIELKGTFIADELPRVMESIDVLILPSLRGEGLPMAVIEAMLAGVVPVCTPISSVSEIVMTGETGFLVAPGSARELASCLVALDDNRTALDSVASRARDFALRHLQAEQNFAVLPSLYRELFRGSSRQSS